MTVLPGTAPAFPSSPAAIFVLQLTLGTVRNELHYTDFRPLATFNPLLALLSFTSIFTHRTTAILQHSIDFLHYPMFHNCSCRFLDTPIT